MLAKVLLDLGALQLGLLPLLRDVLVEAHSHADLTRKSQLAKVKHRLQKLGHTIP